MASLRPSEYAKFVRIEQFLQHNWQFSDDPDQDTTFDELERGVTQGFNPIMLALSAQTRNLDLKWMKHGDVNSSESKNLDRLQRLLLRVNALFAGPAQPFRMAEIDFAPVEPRPDFEEVFDPGSGSCAGLRVLLVERAAVAAETGQAIDETKKLATRFGRTLVLRGVASDLARRVYPDGPLLGLDVLRECSSGRLFCCELNPWGHNWHFSSQIGRSMQRDHGLDFEGQFNAFHTAADVLIQLARQRVH